MSYEKILYNIPKLAVSIDLFSVLIKVVCYFSKNGQRKLKTIALLYILFSFSIEVMDSGINTRKSKNNIDSSENSFTAFKFILVQENYNDNFRYNKNATKARDISKKCYIR